jgi:hypothetical protein
MDNIRLATESLLRLIQNEIDQHALLIAADDIFEAAEVPALLLQGPTPVEDARRRTFSQWTHKDQDNMTFYSGRYPRLYHLDFEIVASTGDERSLLNIIGKTALFYQLNPLLSVTELGFLNITELTPLGGYRRVNLSNLRQASGRLRIEDCPVGDADSLQTESGNLIVTPNVAINIGG